MRNGKLGILVVVLALIFSMFGGFLLNAEDKTVCATNYSYVTDVAGAFSGSGSDIKVDYDPATNITGYSVFSPVSENINTNTIHGINHSSTNANGFWITENKGNTYSKALTFNHTKSTNSSNVGSGTVSVDGSPHTVSIEGEFGLNNSEVRTIITVNGQTIYRVVGIPLSSLMGAIGTLDTDNAYITVSNTVNDYPCFIAHQSFNVYMSGSGASRFVANEVTYDDKSYQIKLNPSTATVEMNNNSYSYSDITFVWGSANDTTAAATLYVGSTSETKYINPVNGVQPTSVHTSNTIVTQTTSKATIVRGTITVDSENYAKGDANVTLDGGTNYPLFNYKVYNIPGDTIAFKINNSWWIPSSYVTGQPITLTWQFSMNDFEWVYLWFNTSYTQTYSSREFVGIYPPALALIDGANVNMNAHRTGATNTIYDVTHNLSSSTGGNTSINTIRTTTQTETVDYNYTTTYWANGYNNTNLSMLIKQPSSALANTYAFTYDLKSGGTYSDSLLVNYNGSSWVVTLNNLSPLNVGNWPAIMLNMGLKDGVPFYYIEPIAINGFVSFQDYNKVGNSYQLVDPAWALNDRVAFCMHYITFANTDNEYMWHEIVKTTVLLAGGGLYVQDGRFTPATSFPNDLMIQFKVMSAAHIGDSMTITTSGGNSTTILSNGFDGWVFNDKTYNFADVAIFYVDDSVPITNVGGKVYDGGIYYNGSVYAKGHLYLQLGPTSELIDLGQSTHDFIISLDGTWAVSTAYYVGANEGKETTELSEVGWQWNKEEFLIVFLGTILVGSIIAAWKFGFGGYDWIAVICSAAVLYLIVG